MASHFVFS